MEQLIGIKSLASFGRKISFFALLGCCYGTPVQAGFLDAITDAVQGKPFANTSEGSEGQPGGDTQDGAPTQSDPSDYSKFSLMNQLIIEENPNNYKFLTDKLSAIPAKQKKNAVTEFIKLNTYNKIVSGCAFPDGEVAAFKAKMSRSPGLLQPVFKIPATDNSIFDWPATEALHNFLSAQLRLNILPLSETKKYEQLLSKYLDARASSDIKKYHSITNSGGILGTLMNMGENAKTYSDTSNPNIRLGGYINENYYNEVISKLNMKPGYVISIGDPRMTVMYYFGLLHAAQDGGMVDAIAPLQAAMYSSRNYYYGLIDEKKASESSFSGAIASHFVKVRIHGSGGLNDIEQKMAGLTRQIEETMMMLTQVCHSTKKHLYNQIVAALRFFVVPKLAYNKLIS